MQRFQGLHVVSKDHTPRGEPTGLRPYLAHPRKPRAEQRSKPHAKWTKVDYAIWTAVAVLVIAYGAIVSFGMGWIR